MQRKYSMIVKSSAIIFTLLSILIVFGCSEKQEAITKIDKSVEPTKAPVLSASAMEAVKKMTTTSTLQQDPLTPDQLLEEFTLDEPVSLSNRFSYTYGYMLMDSALREIPSLDVAYFLKGAVDAALKESELMSKEERSDALYEFQDLLIEEASQRIKELKEKNLSEAESFLAVNSKREGVITTESGLQYEVIKMGEGPTLTESDVAKVNYKLTYLDGQEGDSSVPGVPSTFKVSGLVAGFKEGLLLMKVGSTFRFYVHPSLGYGETGSSRIEPNTLLIFDVDLVDIVD
jgi:FKBP-type peptidyl-prolyl cis-trans isomerase